MLSWGFATKGVCVRGDLLLRYRTTKKAKEGWEKQKTSQGGCHAGESAELGPSRCRIRGQGDFSRALNPMLVSHEA